MNVQVIQGDCLEYLKSYKDNEFDLCLTDPPYGIKRDEGFEDFEGFWGFGKPIARKKYKGGWDDERPAKIYFDEILRVSKNAILFGGNYFADYLPQGKHWIVWDKQNTMPTFGDAELLWTNIKRDSVKIMVFQYNGLLGKEKIRHHPTQKPVGLLVEILQKCAKPTDTVLDCFAGSGSTGIACKRLGMSFTLIERDAEYVEIIEHRLKQEKTMFDNM
jgi:DNA modification methylase